MSIVCGDRDGDPVIPIVCGDNEGELVGSLVERLSEVGLAVVVVVVVVSDCRFADDVGVVNVLVSVFLKDPPVATISPPKASR